MKYFTTTSIQFFIGINEICLPCMGPLIGTWRSPKPHNSLNPFPLPPINNTPFHLFFLPLLPFPSLYLYSAHIFSFILLLISWKHRTSLQHTTPLHNLCKISFTSIICFLFYSIYTSFRFS